MKLTWLEASTWLPIPAKKFEPLELSNRDFKQSKPSCEEPPTLELKPLLAHLRYAFLGESTTLPVIISVELWRNNHLQWHKIFVHSQSDCQ